LGANFDPNEEILMKVETIKALRQSNRRRSRALWGALLLEVTALGLMTMSVILVLHSFRA
jgi:hypothetical protein